MQTGSLTVESLLLHHCDHWGGGLVSGMGTEVIALLLTFIGCRILLN